MTIKPEEMLDHLIELNALRAENAKLREALQSLYAAQSLVMTPHAEWVAAMELAREALKGGRDERV